VRVQGRLIRCQMPPAWRILPMPTRIWLNSSPPTNA
jgi:hypothetical protein